MDVLGTYIFNADKGQWLMDNGDPDRSLNAQSAEWGSFFKAREFSDAAYAEEIRHKVTGNDTSFTMQAMH